jgi:TPR repeat protein
MVPSIRLVVTAVASLAHAHAFFTRACDLGDQHGSNLATLYSDGTGVPGDAKARARACELGDDHACQPPGSSTKTPRSAAAP